MSKQRPPPPIGADIPDEELFRRAPPQDECPICFLTLPNVSVEMSVSFEPCCGKLICAGCRSVTFGDNNLCPFCRASSDKLNLIESLQKRATLGDPRAMYNLGVEYRRGFCVKKDMKKAMELFHRAAENGSISAHALLASIYRQGENGVGMNQQKRIHHELAAAMGGHNISRHNIGFVDMMNGHIARAIKHFLIAASDGYDDSLKAVKACYVKGCVSKDDFAMALRANQESNDAVKSEQRETGMKMLNLFAHVRHNPESPYTKSYIEHLKAWTPKKTAPGQHGKPIGKQNNTT